jgi:hypothetical protein
MTSLINGSGDLAPLEPFAVAQWISTIPPHLQEKLSTTPTNAKPNTWYHHPNILTPIIMLPSNPNPSTTWLTGPTPDLNPEKLSPINPDNLPEVTIHPMAITEPHLQSMSTRQFAGPTTLLPAYNHINILLQHKHKPPIPVANASSSDLYWNSIPLKPITTDRWNNYPQYVPPNYGPIRTRHSHPLFPKKIQDLRFKIYHKAITCGFVIKQDPSTEFCKLCLLNGKGNIIEKIVHRFIECDITTQPLWEHVSNLINQEISPSEKLFGLQHITSPEDIIKDTIIGATQWTIWIHRNRVIHDDPQDNPDAQPTFERAKKIFQSFLHYHLATLQLWINTLDNKGSNIYNPAHAAKFKEAQSTFPNIFHEISTRQPRRRQRPPCQTPTPPIEQSVATTTRQEQELHEADLTSHARQNPPW